MEISKPNDIFVATLNNPEATSYDLMSLNINPENTSLYSKDEYKQNEKIIQAFTSPDGKFDDNAFNTFYNKALSSYNTFKFCIFLLHFSLIMIDIFTYLSPNFYDSHLP